MKNDEKEVLYERIKGGAILLQTQYERKWN